MSYRKVKKKQCAYCGMVAFSMRQLHVHHLDHDHNNNDPCNLETLCANCHAIEHSNADEIIGLGEKAELMRDYLNKKKYVMLLVKRAKNWSDYVI